MAFTPGNEYEAPLRETVEELLRFRSIDGEEGPAQAWLNDRLEDLGFTTYSWEADADMLARHPSFPDDPTHIETENRPNVAGVVEFGDPDAGPTLILNGHIDVVPVERRSWSSDPFEPTWSANGQRLTARGAADMKSGLAACIYAAYALAEDATDLDGRIAVESVVGEEAGGIGAAAAALDNPYPFDRDAALVAEPTEMRPVTAVEGSAMMRLELVGRSAHAATRWRGESVLPHFHRIHDAFHELEAERSKRVTHPLYEEFEIPWPVNVGVLRAGNWASSVPAELEAEVRIGVAPGETVDSVVTEFQDRLDIITDSSEWLREHPPSFERFSVQFEPAEVDPTEAIVDALRATLREVGYDDTPTGATYGADARHYIAADIPAVVFGPGTIDEGHYPDETIEWSEVVDATTIIAKAARRMLS